MQWALDWATAATDEGAPVAPERRRIALRMLQDLAADPLAGPEERDLIAAILGSGPPEASRSLRGRT